MCHFGRCTEGIVGVFKNYLWHRLQKFEDPCLGPLVLPKGLIIHEKINGLLLFGQCVQPACKFFCCEGIILPSLVGKPESYIIAQLKIFQEHFQPWFNSITVKIIRALPSKNMLGSFCKHGLESKLINRCPNFIRINKLRISEHCWLLIKQLPDKGSVLSYLLHKLIIVF